MVQLGRPCGIAGLEIPCSRDPILVSPWIGFSAGWLPGSAPPRRSCGKCAVSESSLFVARDGELASLDNALDDVLAGHGCVRFVVGEAGSGKTALVSEFARRAQSRHEDVLVAVGQSDAQTGIGDPFLPFRELLGQLTGDVDAKLAQGGITEENAGRLRRFLGYSGQAIVDFGPDLIGAFIPGVGLATRAATYAARKSGHLDKLDELTQRPESTGGGGIDQSNIFEQYTNVVTRLSKEQPLVLILDDLQWADTASAGLLFRLGVWPRAAFC